MHPTFTEVTTLQVWKHAYTYVYTVFTYVLDSEIACRFSFGYSHLYLHVKD